MSTSVPLQTRLRCVERANGICEHCQKPLVAVAMRSDTFPCWKCGRKTTVEVGSETADEPLQTAYLDESRALETSYIMQHCSHCGAKIGDHFLNERLLDYPEEFYGTEFAYHLHHANFDGDDHREENLMVVHPECHREIHAIRTRESSNP